ncbi:MAG: hypothetical protein QM786_15690 [Breznakibacter sp.]
MQNLRTLMASLPFSHVPLVFAAFVMMAFIPSDDWEKDVIKKLKTYQAIYRQEKLFVQTDRPIYAVGEDLWFSAFLLEASTHLPNKSESVLYVELVKPSGTTALKQIFKLQNGRAWGSIPISDKLSGGEYHLVAYTNWMRNFGSEFYFRRNITVVNDNDVPARADTTHREIESGGHPSLMAADDEKLLLSFFPEGGDMVEGVNCRVAFEGLTQFGRAASFQGAVVDETGQTVCSISSMWEGKGYFMLNPQSGKTYQAVVDGPDGARYTYALPQARRQGFHLAVESFWQSPDLLVSVSNVSETQGDEAIFLLGLQNGVPKVAMKGVLTNGESTFKISKSDFTTGIVQLTLFDSRKTPCCERLVFVNNNQRLNLSVHEIKLPGGPRGQAEFELRATDKDGRPVMGDFAVSVTDARRIPDAAYRSVDMAQYLALTSNLPGNVYDPSECFDNSRKAQLKTDLLMLTNGWRRYDWRNVLADTIQVPSYLEEPGIYVQGRLLRKSNLKQAPSGLDVTMFVSGKMQVFSEKTGSGGDFTFLLRDFYDTLNAVVQTRNKMSANADYVIDLSSNLKSKPADNFSKLFVQNSGNEPVSFTPAVEESGLTIEKGSLKNELVRALKTDFFIDTTDVTIDEVVVTADRLKSDKEKIIAMYGAPDYGVNKKQIEKMVKDNPWQYGLMSILGDAIPGLYLDCNAVTIAQMPQTSGLGINSSWEVSNTASIRFRLLNKIPHRFFIYVDGEMVGATDDKGVLKSMLRLYSIEELISMDPEVVASVELTFPKKGKDANSLQSQAAMSAAGITDVAESTASQADAAVQGTSADMLSAADETASGANVSSMPEIYTSPEAVLAIYTTNGAGLRAKTRYKGIVNVTLQGFSRVKEFYQPNYLGDKPDNVLEDKRNTLAWLPSLKTDSLGTARISFFTSDVADQFRFEVNGLSSSGLPGSLVHMAQASEFAGSGVNDVQPETAQSAAGVNVYDALGRNVFNIRLPDGSPGAYVSVSALGKEWSTCTNADGFFAIDTVNVVATDRLMFSKAGYKTRVADVTSCAGKDVVLERVDPVLSDKSVAEIVKRMQQKLTANRNPNNFIRQGYYRERILADGQLMQLTDFVFVQKWPLLSNTTASIDTRLQAGRRFSAENYATIIGFEPQNKYNDAVPLLDPVYSRLSFVDQNFVKYYDYKLDGMVDFQGRPMYLLSFDQTDKTQWVFYSGQLLVDSATYGIAWARWKVSPKAQQWLMPDIYLAVGGDQSTFKVLYEHNEITYGFNGEFWVPQSALAIIDFSQKNQKGGYLREMVWSVADAQSHKLKRLDIGQMKYRNMLVKQPAYNPQRWRKPWFLLPDSLISGQIKYLNEVTVYSVPDGN